MNNLNTFYRPPLYFVNYNGVCKAFCEKSENVRVKRYGKNVDKKIAKFATNGIADVVIFPNDPLNVVKQKIQKGFYMDNSTDIKLICHKIITNIQDTIDEIIFVLYKTAINVIDRDVFYEELLNIFEFTEAPHIENLSDQVDKTLAKKILEKLLATQKLKLRINMNDDWKTLDFYKPSDNIIIISEIGKKSKEDSLIIYEDIKDIYDINNDESVTCAINHVFVKVYPYHNNEFVKKLDLYSIFTVFQVNEHIPFAKWLSVNNALLKISREFLTNKENHKKISIWGKFDKKKHFNNEVIVFKVFPGDSVISTVILYGNGICDIRINISKIKSKSLRNNVAFIEDKLNDTYAIIQKYIINLDPFSFKNIFENTSKRVKIMDIQMVGLFTPVRSLELYDVEQLLTMEKDVFHNMQSNSNNLKFLYKKTSSFYDEGNIKNWMNKLSKHYKQKELSKMIKELFIEYPSESLNELYTSWSNSLNNVKQFLKYFKTDANSVFLNLKKGQMGFKFNIEGSSSLNEVLLVVLYLINSLRTKKINTTDVKKIQFTNIEEDENIHDDDLDDIFSILGLNEEDEEESENNIAAQEEEEEVSKKIRDNESYGEDVPDGSVNKMMQMKNSKKCPVPTNTNRKVKQDQEDGDQEDEIRDRYVLDELNKTDPNLFSTGKGVNTYAKICQSASSRQPLPLTADEIEYSNKCFNSVPKYLKTGSSDKYYTCPQIWCPQSRVALTMQDFEKFGKKCPFGLAEKPMNFMGSYFQKKGIRTIGLLSEDKHKDLLKMPCCFASANIKAKTDDSVKYIQGSRPSKGRYASLPIQLHRYFENKNCGSEDNIRGLMGPKTRCYLRYGINPTPQTFLGCLKESLNFKTEEEIINLIKDKMNLSVFLLCDNGRLFKLFMYNISFPLPGEEEYYKDHFKECIDFLVKNKSSLKKIFSIEWEYLEMQLKFKTFLDYFEDKFFMRVFKRFYIFYHVYKNFLLYLDGTAIKTHDILLPIIESLGLFDVNVIVLHDNFIECPKHIYENKSVLILYNYNQNIYEPVHFVEYIKSKVKARQLQQFNDNIIRRLLNCTSKIDDTNKELITGADTLIYDFEFRTVGVVYSENVFIPLKEPVFIEYFGKKKVCFIDSFFEQDAKFYPNLEKAQKILDSFNIKFKSTTQKSYLVLEGYSFNIIPLNGFKKTNLDGKTKKIMDEQTLNGEIFSHIQKIDKRINVMRNELKNQVIYESLLNELYTLYTFIPRVKQEFDFVRHVKNPLPMIIKIQYLRNFLLNLKSFTKRFYVSSKNAIKLTETFERNSKPIVCSKLAPKKCISNNMACTYIQDGKSGHCVVKFQDNESFEFLLDKALYYICNPINKIELKVQKRFINGISNMADVEDMLVIDIKDTNDLLNITELKNDDYDLDLIEDDFRELNKTDLNILKESDLKMAKHKNILLKPKDFMWMKIDSSISNDDALIKLFLQAYNIKMPLSNQMTEDGLRRKVLTDNFSIEELIYKLSSITKTNIIIAYRKKKQTNPDQEPDPIMKINFAKTYASYVMMFFLNDDKLYVLAKDNNFILDLESFDKDIVQTFYERKLKYN